MTRDPLRAAWDEDVSILSAENVNFALETAGLGSRFTAVLIDMTLQMLTMILLAMLAGSVSIYLPDLDQVGNWVSSLGGALMALVVFLITYGYYFLFEWLMDGQTPGKRWLGLRVLQTSGMPLTIWAAFTRNLLRIVDFLPFSYGLGALVAVLNPHNRRVGDLVAGTLVVRERSLAKRQVLNISAAADAFLASFTNAPASPQPAHGAVSVAASTSDATVSATPHGAAPHGATSNSAAANGVNQTGMDPQQAALRMRLDDQDYELARDFLLRRDKLPEVARQRLAHSLTTRLCVKLGQPLPPPGEAERFLETVAAAFGGMNR